MIQRARPEVHTSMGRSRTATFWASSQEAVPGMPHSRYKTLQMSLTFNGGEVVDEDFIRDIHENELAVHVWAVNDRETMDHLIALNVDGIMTDRPTVLADVLRERDMAYECLSYKLIAGLG